MALTKPDCMEVDVPENCTSLSLPVDGDEWPRNLLTGTDPAYYKGSPRWSVHTAFLGLLGLFKHTQSLVDLSKHRGKHSHQPAPSLGNSFKFSLPLQLLLRIKQHEKF